MSILPSQVEQPDPQIELAFAPDLSIHPAGWDWTDATTDRLAQSIAIKKGRSDEFGIVSPAGTAFQIDNRSGVWTPADARSPHWPHMERNTPVRISLTGGTPYVLLDGDPANFVQTTDTAALDITSDIDLRAEVDMGWQDDTPRQTLIGKWEPTGDQRSYMLWTFRTNLNAVGLIWSPDGTSAASLQAAVVTPAITRGAVRATLDVNNGAGGWTATFYWGLTLAGPWLLMGSSSGVGTTSIHSGSAPLRVGPSDSTPSVPRNPFIGHGYRFEVYAGLTGSDRRAALDFTVLPNGASPFVDDEGLTWTFGGAAAVTDRDVRCFGQIGEITPTWPYGDISGDDPDEQPGEARVDITIAGILRRLSQGAKALRSTLYRSITSPSRAANVYAYWPLEVGRDATEVGSATPGVLPGTMGLPFAADDTLTASDSLPSQSAGEPLIWTFTIPPTVPTTGWEVTFFVRIPTPADAGAGDFTTLMRVDAKGGTVSQWVIRIDDTDLSLFAKDLDGTNILTATVPSDDRMFDTWALVSLSIVQSGADILYDVDFIPIPLGVVFGPAGTLSTRTCGRPTGLRNLAPEAPPDGISFGHFIVTSGMVTGWLAGADTAWVNETAAHRIFRLCKEEQIPVEIIGDELVNFSTRGDPTLSTPMGPQRLKTIIELLSECADTDMGILSEQELRPGIRYRTRRSLYNQAPALELDAGTSDIDNPFVPTFDDQSLRNDITASREDGSEYRVTTDPPPQPGDVYQETATVNVASDSNLVDQAGWRLHLGTWPGMRYRNVTSELTVAPHQMDPWRSMRLGDRAQIINLPPQHPAPTVDLLVQGWTETFSSTRWTIEANCTPAGPWDVGVLDDDTPTTSLARLITDGSTLAGSLTETATGAVSVTVAGPLWSTSAGQFPMDVEIGGEVVTISGISGASSPQTFTITARAVNGVRKAHAAGADVNAAVPFRVAM